VTTDVPIFHHINHTSSFSPHSRQLSLHVELQQPKETCMTARIVGNKLVIEIPLNSVPVASTSGKTLVVASTHGNKVTEAQVNGKNLVIGLNAYIPKN
jgi:hypothetical protein